MRLNASKTEIQCLANNSQHLQVQADGQQLQQMILFIWVAVSGQVMDVKMTSAVGLDLAEALLNAGPEEQ